MMKVMVCGVDCKKRDHNCNGYCEGKAQNPPDATEAQKRLAARKAATDALTAAERAWYEYAGLCEVGDARTRAFAVYENVRNSRRL
jgi:hypothetical protein